MAGRKRYHDTAEYVDSVGRMIRAAGRRVGGSDPPDLARLINLREELETAVTVAVIGQRAQGITWAWIGQATGTTKQAAILKWADAAREALAEEAASS
jgi:hypothetical protein